jgi:hypothetical protein
MANSAALRMAEQRWTATLVADRLAEAVDTLARLPDERARGLYDLWPKLIGAPGGHARRGAAAPEAIDHNGRGARLANVAGGRGAAAGVAEGRGSSVLERG